MRALLATLLLFLAGCTCGPDGPSHTRPPAEAEDETDDPAPSRPTFADVAGGLAWSAPEPLVSRRPSSPMRAAEYTVRDHDDTELTVFHFGAGQGGSVDDNVERWVSQFTQADGRASRDAAEIDHVESHGVAITTIDVSGTYAAMSPGGATAAPRDGMRMLGAIAEGPEGMVFFKLTGPDDAVEEAEDAFRQLVESIAPAS